MFLFVAKLRNKTKKGIRANHNDFIVIPVVFKYRGNRYILTTGKDPSKCVGGDGESCDGIFLQKGI